MIIVFNLWHDVVSLFVIHFITVFMIIDWLLFKVIIVRVYNMCFPSITFWKKLERQFEQNILCPFPPIIAEIPATLKLYPQILLGVPKTHFSCTHKYPRQPFSSSFNLAIRVMSSIAIEATAPGSTNFVCLRCPLLLPVSHMKDDPAPYSYSLGSQIMILRFTHVVACIGCLIVFITELYPLVYTDHILFTHSLVTGHIGCFQFGTMTYKAAMSIHVKVFV